MHTNLYFNLHSSSNYIQNIFKYVGYRNVENILKISYYYIYKLWGTLFITFNNEINKHYNIGLMHNRLQRNSEKCHESLI